ncbi:DUF1772 domain-containing protein [Schlegelella sp. S2-27]|uniref:DUF1772 domain-containing protein n=1 Tax=Caldimonas mangrovi TaxID=2944811 RepID=A0ABT0YGV3_9BURK|nr:anthrone oxygenase family protein [Caldimonas mangrovi]MCM5677935.1 DUF1772 domain-containing protein [Caldimonas mangrovi]
MDTPLTPYRLSAIAATLLLGLMAGFFFAFAVDVAPAMTHLDAAAYVETQQWINRVVRNLPFALAYFGSTLLAIVPAVLAARARQLSLACAWAIVAIVYFAAVFWVTRSVNVPINDALALWNPAAPPAEWSQWRDRWNEANDWRALASFGCFAAALVLTALPAPAEASNPTLRGRKPAA